jgi:CBS domain-containing protein
MKSPVIVIDSEETVHKAVQEMNRHKIASLLVRKGGKDVGMLTERDILERVVQKGFNTKETRIEDVMSTPIHYLDEDSTIGEAAKMMVSLMVKKLLVEREGQAVGIVTIKDVIQSLISQHNDVLEEWEKNILEAWKEF